MKKQENTLGPLDRSCSRCLVMTFGAKGVGDHLTASPVVRNLAQNAPSCSIDLGVFSPVGIELFKHNPFVHTIHLLDMDHLKLGGRHGLGDSLRYIREFRKRKYDRVYVLGSKLRHALFAYLTGAPVRIGYDTYHRGPLLTRTAKEPLVKNMVERFLDLLRMDGVAVTDPCLDIFISRAEERAAQEVLGEHGVIPGERFIVIAPFAADMRRTWGIQKFWKVAETIAREDGTKIVVLGGPGDRTLMNTHPLPSVPGKMIDLVGTMDILGTAAVIRKAHLFLGNDSGLGHLAGAVGTTALVIGYYITRTWLPVSRATIRTIIDDIGCQSCKMDECGRYSEGELDCFRAIGTERVIRELREMGENSPTGTDR